TRTGLVKLLVEIVEALVESKRRRDRVRADERRRAITLALEESRQRRVLRPEREDHVAADAVHRRVLSREDRGVRWTGERYGALDLIEADPVCRQRVERWRHAGHGLGGAVRADVVCPQRVDRDEQQVGMRWRRRPRRPPRPPRRCAEDGGEAGRRSEPSRRTSPWRR